jgi:glutamate racemase
MDSGVGGLTVLKELKALLPGEGFLYFGDSANNPFGNRSKEELLRFNHRMLDFFAARGVEAVAIACNTTSVLEEIIQKDYDFPLVGIIKPVARSVASSGVDRIGVIATRFTIASGAYRRFVNQDAPRITVYEKASESLAGLVDRGEYGKPVVTEIAALCDWIKGTGVEQVILACTHYPIVLDEFKKAAPGIIFLDPAVEQAKTLAALVTKRNALHAEGGVSVFTSGDPKTFPPVLKKIGVNIEGWSFNHVGPP